MIEAQFYSSFRADKSRFVGNEAVHESAVAFVSGASLKVVNATSSKFWV